jgi:hypothetical protein
LKINNNWSSSNVEPREYTQKFEIEKFGIAHPLSK